MMDGYQGQRSKLQGDQNLESSVGSVDKEEELSVGSITQEETIQSLDKTQLQIKKEGQLECEAKNTNSSNRNQRRGRVGKISSTDLATKRSGVKQSCRSNCSVKHPCCKATVLPFEYGE